jgi:hypothetical protein
MNYLFTESLIVFPNTDQDMTEFTWNLEFPHNPSESTENIESRFLPIRISMIKRPGSWSPWISDLPIIEAVLALLICQVMNGSNSKYTESELEDDQEPHNI